MSSLLKSPVYTHEYSLCVRTTIATIAESVLANHDRRTNRTLGMIVVQWHILLVQECQEVVAMPPQSFDLPFGILVFPRRDNQLVQAGD